MDRRLCRLHRIVLIVNGGGGTGEVEDLIDLDEGKVTSWRSSSNFGFGSRWAIFALSPVKKLSAQITSWPSAISLSHK